MRIISLCAQLLIASLVLASGGPAMCHGNVTPQPVDTTGLPNVGPDWKTVDPYAGNKKAIEIGASGYLQNCARCHGLEMEAGGLAPDLHQFPVGPEGDEIYAELVRNGKTQNGAIKMPAFYPTVSQEGLWAIRVYIESKHTD